MRTAAPGIFAVGDIAAAWHPLGKRRLRVEHWGDANAHGRVAGGVLAGEHPT
jgi:NADPH-dependent 2,4-dienoyl-CoA reductase/sulfur reductase-like enzyme